MNSDKFGEASRGRRHSSLGVTLHRRLAVRLGDGRMVLEQRQHLLIDGIGVTSTHSRDASTPGLVRSAAALISVHRSLKVVINFFVRARMPLNTPSTVPCACSARPRSQNHTPCGNLLRCFSCLGRAGRPAD